MIGLVGTTLLAASLGFWVATLPTSKPDFAILWAAPQLNAPYDHVAVAHLLGWGADDPPATFVYPPSALPIFAFFSQLKFSAALTLWAALSGAALALSSRSSWAPLILFTPPVLWALPGGQTSVLMGALIFGALQTLDRPRLSGVLLGLALCIKPQLAFLIPAALVVTGRWRTVGVTVLTFVIIVAISGVVFGAHQWLVWLQYLPDYLLLHENNPNLRRNEIAFGLATWLRVTAFLVGGFLTWRAIKDNCELEAFVLSLCTALLVSPHAMGYEFAVLSPAYIALIAKRGWAASATLLLIISPILVWAFGDALLPYRPRLIAVVLLAVAVTADGVARKKRSATSARADGDRGHLRRSADAA